MRKKIFISIILLTIILTSSITQIKTKAKPISLNAFTISPIWGKSENITFRLLNCDYNENIKSLSIKFEDIQLESNFCTVSIEPWMIENKLQDFEITIFDHQDQILDQYTLENVYYFVQNENTNQQQLRQTMKDVKYLIVDQITKEFSQIMAKSTQLEGLFFSSWQTEDYSALLNLHNIKYLHFATFYFPSKYLQNMDQMRVIHSYSKDYFDNYEIFRNFPNLIYFYGERIKINDLSIFENTTNLEYFNLSIAYWDAKPEQNNLDFLKNNKNLQKLIISDLKIENLSTISNLNNLSFLSLNHCNIKNINALSNLSNLIYLNLDQNKIENIQPIVNLTKLEEISFKENQIEIIPDINTLKNAKTIQLQDNKIKNFNNIVTLPNLKTLVLENNNISTINFLSKLTSLEILDIDNNLISELSPISNLFKLKKLSAMNNEISDINSLIGLWNLEELNLDSNNITNIWTVSNLEKLNSLSLQNNNIENIGPISNLKQLEYLNISQNNISVLIPLSCHPSLTTVAASNNQITDISPLNTIPNLETTFLRGNDFPIDSVEIYIYDMNIEHEE